MPAAARSWEVYEIVAELIEQKAKAPPSRNRNFEDWADPARSAAYKLYARLLTTRRDLQTVRRAGGTPRVNMRSDGGRSLSYELDVPQGPLRRTAHFEAPEWDLLLVVCGAALVDV